MNQSQLLGCCDFGLVEQILAQAVETVTPAAQVVVRWHGNVVLDLAAGWLDPQTRCQPATKQTRFDMASVTKLFATTAFMRLVEVGRVELDQPVSTVLKEFVGLRPILPYEDPLQSGKMVEVSESREQVDAGEITFRQLLSHQSGLPAWRPLFQQVNALAAQRMALETFFSYVPGQRVVYSDIGLILLGLAIERLAAAPLDIVVRQQVIEPLGLEATGYIRLDAPVTQDVFAPTEFCAWRNRRISGEVHDENAWRLGGVSAHAGIFSTASDCARFGQCFLDGGVPLLSAPIVDEMASLQAEYESTRRGLGFALWSPDPEASSNPFSQATFGHTGFTGTSLWMDPQRQCVIALLTNDVYSGRQGRGIADLRVRLHRAVVQAVDTSNTGKKI